MTGIVHDLSSLGKGGGVHFVVSGGVEKPNHELRKLIRSHVMLGKNKGKILPPRKKKRKAKAAPFDELSASSSSLGSLSARSHSTASAEDSATSFGSSAQLAVSTRLTVPRQFGSFLATVLFADAAVEPKSVEVVIQFSSISKQTLFPNLEPYIFFDRRAESWIMPLTYDAAFLHTMIFTSQYYFDCISTRKNAKSLVSKPIASQQGQLHFFHFVQTLRLLRERFMGGNEQLKMSFSTAAAVMGLVGHALLSGDGRSARFHMEGLGKIVRLRGGFGTFEGSEKLLLEIFRCDLGIALHGGSPPVFFKNLLREPFVPYPDLTLFFDSLTLDGEKASDNTASLLKNVDHRLREAWRTMADFCTLINIAVRTEQRISTGIFSSTMSSLMYRFLGMSFPLYSKNEIVRLGMIAFTSNIFLQWGHLGMGYPYLSAEYRDCLQCVDADEMSPQLMTWLAMIGGITVLTIEGSDGDWLTPLLRENARLCDVADWCQMKEIMEDVMWIGVVFDDVGEKLFSSLNAI